MTTHTFQIRRSEERGHAHHGWLNSQHTFSFAGYYDPRHMGFRSLRVINEDRIEGGTGFGKHPHKDMEIISYVVKGALQHEDSMGTKAIIKPGEVQRMTAGTGILHAEMNAMPDDTTHFFQIWIMPKKSGDAPGYGQKSFAKELETQKMTLVLSEDARDGSIGIKQDADLYLSRLKPLEKVDFSLREGRGAWIQLVHGEVKLNGETLKSGDAAAIEGIKDLHFEATKDSEFMLFDLA